MTYIFGEGKLKTPVLISFGRGYDNFTIAKGLRKVSEQAWETVILKKCVDKKSALEALRNKIIIYDDDGNKIEIYLKKIFLLIDKIVVKFNDEEIKGNEFVTFG